MPIGQLAGVTSSARVCSISSIKVKGSRPSRSSLLTKVTIGTSRRRQTSKSFLVCASMPLAASSTMTALSTAVSVRYVSSLKSWWPGGVGEFEGEPPMPEGQDRRADRDAALALDLHPVGADTPPIAARLDLAGELDGTAEEQQLLGQGRFAGVGVRDDREGAA